MDKSFFKKYFPYLFLAGCVIVAFAPVAFMQQCMKYDMTDLFFPWRYYVGECLQNDNLPLWNPYTHLGYPIHADPQSGAWYPVVWLIGGVFGYNIYWIQIEFLLHVFLAGVGMYLLANLFINETRVALAVAGCYMLSGFFSGNAQHLVWIISGTWIPFVLYYFLRFQNEGRQSDLLKTALAFFMMFTGGYPAFAFITAYGLLIMSFVHLIRLRGGRRQFFSAFKKYILLAVLTLSCISVAVVSIVESLSTSVRTGVQPLWFILSNPFPPKALLSWLFPLASVKNPELFNTDVSMSNGYMGLIGLIGLLFFVLKCRSRRDLILLITGLLFLFLAFGDATPLRKWFYYIVPLFDRFRFPSLFRLFAIMMLLICSGIGLLNILKNVKNKRTVNGIFIFIATLLIAGIIFSSSQLYGNLVPDLLLWNNYISSLDFYDSIFIQGIFQLVFLIVLIIVFNRSKNFIRLLPWLAALDICVTVLINNPITVVNDEIPSKLYAEMKNFPAGFPVPELRPVELNKDREYKIGQLWLNLGIWKKQPFYNGYNPWQSQAYNTFEDSPQGIHVLKNPLLYFSTSTSLYKDTITDTTAIANNPEHLYLKDESYLQMLALQKDSTARFQITSFGPNQIKVNTRTSQKQWLTLLQQHVNGWKVDVDGEEIKSYTSNYLFISSIIPAGKHEVMFTYQNKIVEIAFWITVFSLLLAIFLLIRGNKKIVQ